MIAPDAVRVTSVVGVDPATAFEVFTDEIDAWWKTGPMYRVEPERKSAMRLESGVGGRLLEIYDEAGDDAFEHGVVRVWKPPQRLVFEMSGRDFRPGERTEVEVRFEAVERGTRVTVEHRGWGAFAADHPVRHGLLGTAFTGMLGSWWGDLLVALGAHAARTRRGPIGGLEWS